MGIVTLEPGTEPIFKNLYTRLQSFDGAKDVYAEVIAKFGGSEINDSNARTMAYLLSGLLAFYKHQLDTDLEERLTRLEEKDRRRGIA